MEENGTTSPWQIPCPQIGWLPPGRDAIAFQRRTLAGPRPVFQGAFLNGSSPRDAPWRRSQRRSGVREGSRAICRRSGGRAWGRRAGGPIGLTRPRSAGLAGARRPPELRPGQGKTVAWASSKGPGREGGNPGFGRLPEGRPGDGSQVRDGPNRPLFADVSHSGQIGFLPRGREAGLHDLFRLPVAYLPASSSQDTGDVSRIATFGRGHDVVPRRGHPSCLDASTPSQFCNSLLML